MNDLVATFQRHQPKLYGIAYRMLGSTADAEDIVQDAYLRWHQSGTGPVQIPEAWLTTIVTRLCIDRLRSARTEREAYPGPWLPEPLFGDVAAQAERGAELAVDLSFAFLLLLERLAPEERAAFLLHEVFDCDYPEIANVLGRNEPACRQIVHRARISVHQGRPRFQVSEATRRSLLEKFATALQAQDHTALLALFAEDATWTADGGGKAKAATKVVRSAERISRFAIGVWRRYTAGLVVSIVPINGELGLLMSVHGTPKSTISIETDGARILAVYTVLNPDKLKKATLLTQS